MGTGYDLSSVSDDDDVGDERPLCDIAGGTEDASEPRLDPTLESLSSAGEISAREFGGTAGSGGDTCCSGLKLMSSPAELCKSARRHSSEQ